MIIRCRKCDTRFRFDETLIDGDGVWVRCSRCQNVFFEERSSGEPLSSAPAGEIPSVRISDAVRSGDSKRISEEPFPSVDEHPPWAERETASVMPTSLTGADDDVPVEIGKGSSLEGLEADMDKEPLHGPTVAEDEEDEGEEKIPEIEPAGRGWGRMLLRITALTVFVVLVAGGVALWVFPDLRIQTFERVSSSLRGIPGVEQLLGTEMKSRETSQTPVRIKDVRQRSVTNLLVGTLRVIEGTAVNQSPTPLANLRVRLVISDAYDVVLGEKIAYCGNLLTDAELNTLAEAEIQRELSTPQGTDVSNQRIAPNGEIPFMIVFSQEQAGAIKTVVMPAGADRVP
jgi:predicted Zn finger-like uncharacterized protein